MSHSSPAPSSTGTPHQRPTVAFGITGSIAAFKAIEIARELIRKGVRVLPVSTRSGARFVGPVALTGLCGEPVRMDMWDETFAGELHVHLAQEADVVVVAPATADILARFATGRADDLLTALVLCARGPVVVAPAMHPRMWAHPATQRSVHTLEQDARIQFVGPVVGSVANGDVGKGRMAEPQDIVSAVMAQLAPQDLLDLHIVVTAGPTVEDLDPVRFITNRSSGKMGMALARRAAARGARVTLIAGPIELPTPVGVNRVDVRSASDMRSALHDVLKPTLDGADALIMAAAVGDYRPSTRSKEKLKRGGESMVMHFVPNPDLLSEIGSMRQGSHPVLIGFAVETAKGDELIELARSKLHRKHVDLIVANRASVAFGKDTNEASLVTDERVEHLSVMGKDVLADRILDHVRRKSK